MEREEGQNEERERPERRGEREIDRESGFAGAAADARPKKTPLDALFLFPFRILFFVFVQRAALLPCCLTAFRRCFLRIYFLSRPRETFEKEKKNVTVFFFFIVPSPPYFSSPEPPLSIRFRSISQHAPQ